MFLQWLFFLRCNSSAVNAIKMCMKWSMSGRIGVTKVSRWPGRVGPDYGKTSPTILTRQKAARHITSRRGIWISIFRIQHTTMISTFLSCSDFQLNCLLIKSNKTANFRSPYLSNWHYMDIFFSFIIKKLLMAKRFIAKSWSIKDDGAELVLRCILS